MSHGDPGSKASEEVGSKTSASPPEPDWAQRATGALEDLVGLVRDRSVRPILATIWLAMLSVVAGALLVVVLVTLVTGLSRLLDNLVFSGRVWATDLLIGGIFAGGGTFLFRLARKEQEDAHG